MVMIPSFLRSAISPAPLAAQAPAPIAPRPGTTHFAIDLFTPSTAHVAQVQAVRRAPTLDDLEGPIAGGYLPTTMEDEPTGGGVNRGVLSEGARGPEVERLQRALAARGFNPGTPDGAFGPDTARALRAFQSANNLQADGDYGPASRAALTGQAAPAPAPAPAPSRPSAPGAPAADTSSTRARLQAGLGNRYAGMPRKCFRYAWLLTSIAGGRGIGNAPQTRAGRGHGTAHIGALVAAGQIRPGDVIYVNRSPGADPSSTNLRYGPHWFVYMGSNQFADQYGVRGAQAMSDFVPGRKIDTIYHTRA